MLKFVSAYLALSYLIFAAFVVAGLLQVLAAWRSLWGLALLDYRRRPPWRWALGPLLIGMGYAWFFGTRREILTPGPAGAELVVLFIGSVLLALALTIAGASLLHPYRRGGRLPAVECRMVPLMQGVEARFYPPGGQSQPAPAICLLPDPSVSAMETEALAAGLARQGFAVLQPAWPASLQKHPDALVLAPAAANWLQAQSPIDAKRLALVGINLGGDLALRAAAADRQWRAVVALAPLVDERHCLRGLGWLREMTYPEAMRWGLGGRRRALVRDLGALGALGQIAPRPTLVLLGSQEGIMPPIAARARLAGAGPAVQVRAVAGEGCLSLASSARVSAIVGEWLAENLSGALT